MRRMLALVFAVGLSGCVGVANNAPVSTSSTSAATTTTRVEPSAYDQLAGYLQAAEKMDRQLSQAAELINGAGPPWTSPLPATVVSSVQAADLRPVAAAIPAGLPNELLQRTILVYSDLASRRYAMRWFGPDGFPYVVPNPQMQSDLLAALANGAPAASRFRSDLGGLISAAHASRSITPAAPTSRAAADLELLLQWTEGLNAGCASTGGVVVTTLPSIVWSAHDGVSGTIAGVDFEARLVNGTWQTTIHAC
ncbi:MAG: hypothetical protein M0000_09245 [Actinomycetota bacterium]|nr:hypothetical protein [Actinomycetota bacterium]